MAAAEAAAAAADEELSPLREVLALPPLRHLLEQPQGRRLRMVARQAYTDFDVCATRLRIKALEDRKEEFWGEVVSNGLLCDRLAARVRIANVLLKSAGRLAEQAIIHERKACEDSMEYANNCTGYILNELLKIDRQLNLSYEKLAREAAEHI
ncbi:unnamed protein product [Urochloa humidicola]